MKLSRIIPLTLAIMAFMCVSVFASEATAIITADMLTPIMSGIAETIKAVTPAAVGVLGTMFGIRIVPKIFYMFF